VQNPGDRPLEFDGVALDLDVNGRPLASGVSSAKGSVARFGETVVSVPVSVNAVSAVRQMLGLSDGSLRGELPYAIRGRLGGGVMGGTRFTSEGTLKLPQ
jgi:Late embryogenesis abundant protein